MWFYNWTLLHLLSSIKYWRQQQQNPPKLAWSKSSLLWEFLKERLRRGRLCTEDLETSHSCLCSEREGDLTGAKFSLFNTFQDEVCWEISRRENRMAEAAYTAVIFTWNAKGIMTSCLKRLPTPLHSTLKQGDDTVQRQSHKLTRQFSPRMGNHCLKPFLFVQRCNHICFNISDSDLVELKNTSPMGLREKKNHFAEHFLWLFNWSSAMAVA